jgi:hypothetical protein
VLHRCAHCTSGLGSVPKHLVDVPAGNGGTFGNRDISRDVVVGGEEGLA